MKKGLGRAALERLRNEDVPSLYLSGYNTGEIAKRIGYSPKTVRSWCRKWIDRNYRQEAERVMAEDHLPPEMAVSWLFPFEASRSLRMIAERRFRMYRQEMAERSVEADADGEPVSDKENHTMDKEERKREEKSAFKGGMSLSGAFILAAVIALVIGVVSIACLASVPSTGRTAHGSGYESALYDKYDSLEKEMERTLRLRNAEMARLDRLSEEIRTATFEYEKSAQYVMLYDNQLEYVQQMMKQVDERIEEANGSYSSSHLYGF